MVDIVVDVIEILSFISMNTVFMWQHGLMVNTLSPVNLAAMHG